MTNIIEVNKKVISDIAKQTHEDAQKFGLAENEIQFITDIRVADTVGEIADKTATSTKLELNNYLHEKCPRYTEIKWNAKSTTDLKAWMEKTAKEFDTTYAIVLLINAVRLVINNKTTWQNVKKHSAGYLGEGALHPEVKAKNAETKKAEKEKADALAKKIPTSAEATKEATTHLLNALNATRKPTKASAKLTDLQTDLLALLEKHGIEVPAEK